MGVEHRPEDSTHTAKRKQSPPWFLPFLPSFLLWEIPPKIWHASKQQSVNRSREWGCNRWNPEHKSEANSVPTREVKATGLDIHVGMGTCLFRQVLQVTSCVLLNDSNDNKKPLDAKRHFFYLKNFFIWTIFKVFIEVVTILLLFYVSDF